MLAIILIYIFFALGVGSIGSGRKIGFFSAFIFSLILSPLIGWLITLAYPKIDEKNNIVVVSESENKSIGSQKACPDCAEDVKVAALKCKHCGYRWS